MMCPAESQGERHKATWEEMQIQVLPSSFEEHQLGKFSFPVFVFSTQACSQPGCRLAAEQPHTFWKPKPSLARAAQGTRHRYNSPELVCYRKYHKRAWVFNNKKLETVNKIKT